MKPKLSTSTILLLLAGYYLCGRALEIVFYLRLIDESGVAGKILYVPFAPVFYLKSWLYNLGIPG
jgi:hypothetical protein